MAESVLNNNIFEFHSKAYQQKSGTPIGAKFAPPNACIYMDQVEQVSSNAKQKTAYLIKIHRLYVFYLDSW